MAHFIAIKIHYDHRKSLPAHLKYSQLPTLEQYNDYLRLYREENKGGNGFHECLNFAITEDNKSRIYLPPTSKPAEKYLDEEMVIFSFTYKEDEELPAHIIGVHAGVTVLDKDGIVRPDMYQLDGIDEELFYHAEAPECLTTLFTPPIEYDFRQGIYTPVLKNWGFGLRNLEEGHASKIIKTAYDLAVEKLKMTTALTEKEVLSREIGVLKAIDERYFNSKATAGIRNKLPPNRGVFQPPDKEIGYLGERLVYEDEIKKVRELGCPENMIEWVSQVSPQSPFDIKTIRMINGKLEDYYIEVKSTRSLDESNIYVSSRQVDFFSKADPYGEFALVSFQPDKTLKQIRRVSFPQLKIEFDFEPIKFRLISKEFG